MIEIYVQWLCFYGLCVCDIILVCLSVVVCYVSALTLLVGLQVWQLACKGPQSNPQGFSFGGRCGCSLIWNNIWKMDRLNKNESWITFRSWIRRSCLWNNLCVSGISQNVDNIFRMARLWDTEERISYWEWSGTYFTSRVRTNTMEQMFECYYPMTAPPGESIRISQIRLEYNVVQLDIQPLSAVVVLAYFNFFFF